MANQKVLLKPTRPPEALEGLGLSTHLAKKRETGPVETSDEVPFTKAFNALKEPVWIMDAACRIQCCNRAAQKLCGNGIIGRHCWEVVHGTSGRVANCPFTRMRQSGRREHAELAIGARWFNCTVDPLFDTRKRISGAVHVMWDITGQRRTQKALQETKKQLKRRVAERTVELKKINASLVQSESQLRRFIESAPVAIAMFDRAMNYLAASRRWLSDYGLEGRDIIGRSHYKIFPELPNRLKVIHRRGLAGETLGKAEDCFKRADGSVQWLRWEMQPWFEVAGDIGGIVIFTEDITERVRLTQQSIATGNRLKADVKALTLLHQLSMLSLEGRKHRPVLEQIVKVAIAISGASGGNIQLLDPTASELKIMAHHGLPGWWVRYWNKVQKGKGVCGTALEQGKRIIVADVEHSPIFVGTPELKIQLKAGVRAVQSTPLISRTGKILGMFSTHYRTPQQPDERTLQLLDLLARQAADMLERMQAEETLRASEARERARALELETIFNTAPIGLAISHDPHGHSIRGNRKSEEMFGLPPGGELSKAGPRAAHFRVFQEGREMKVSQLPMQRAIRGENVTGLEMEVVRENGRTVAVYASAAPLFDASGRLSGAVGTFLDITPRKRAERSLRKSEERFRALTMASSDVIYRMSPDWNEMIELHGRNFIADTGKPSRNWLQKYIHPEDQPQVMETIRKAIRTKSTFELEHRVMRADGSPGWTYSRAIPVLDAHGKILEWFGMARDVTARREAEELLRQTNRTLQTIRDCHEVMLRATTEKRLLKEICRIIVQTGGGRMTWVGFAESDTRKTVRPVTAAGANSDYLRRAHISWANVPRGRGPVGMAIRTGKTYICNDTQKDPNFAPWRANARRQGFGSTIALPLIVEGKRIGALSIYASKPGTFDASEQLLLTDLANDLAFGISMLRLRAQRERLENEILKSAEREQERIGRDLHDGLCQVLVGAKFRSGYLKKIVANQHPEATKEASALEAILNRAIEQTRDLARDLNPLKVTPDNLREVLQKLASEIREPHCFCHFAEPLRLSDHHVAYHLFRIAQEAVQNAQKHASAKNISITLSRKADRYALTVKDDGVGIPLKLKTTGAGLKNIQIRARLIGGTVEIRRRKHGGTAITCEFPQNSTNPQSHGQGTD